MILTRIYIMCDPYCKMLYKKGSKHLGCASLSWSYTGSQKIEGTFSMMKTCVIPVLLLMGSTCLALSGSHSHYFYSTLTYNPSFNFPSYYTTRTLDGITLYWYDSDNEVIERRVPWFKGHYESLWDLSNMEFNYHKSMNTRLQNYMDYLNQTGGYHILQELEGCTLYDNGTFQASLSRHYDGKPFMSFNVEKARWTAETPDAETFAQRFNSNETALQQLHYNLVNTCIPHITELLALGNCTFIRKEVPVVKVTQIPVDNGKLRVHCRAYGHYPKDISIMWYKNGKQLSEEMMERTTLPLLDLTFLTSLSFNDTSMADDLYTCRVNHSSMPRDFTQNWSISGDFENLSSAPSGLSDGAVIAICMAVTLIIVIVVFGSVLFAKSRQP